MCMVKKKASCLACREKIWIDMFKIKMFLNWSYRSTRNLSQSHCCNCLMLKNLKKNLHPYWQKKISSFPVWPFHIQGILILIHPHLFFGMHQTHGYILYICTHKLAFSLSLLFWFSSSTFVLPSSGRSQAPDIQVGTPNLGKINFIKRNHATKNTINPILSTIYLYLNSNLDERDFKKIQNN